MRRIVAFDVGGTKIKHGLLEEDGAILLKGSCDTPSNDLEKLLAEMEQTVQMYTENGQVDGIAVSLPGLIYPDTGFVEHAGAVTALHRQNLKNLLQPRVNLPVVIENDGNCAAIAEKMSGNATVCSDFICITIGTGIGGGMFVGGKLHRGSSNGAGEFGYMIVQGDLWNANGSTSALIQAYKEMKGISEEEYVSGETIFLEAEKDLAVRKVVDGWVKTVSYGIVNLAAVVNPEKMLLGGGIMSQPGLLSKIVKQLQRIPWWREICVPVEGCKHQNDAGMIGAVYSFLQKK